MAGLPKLEDGKTTYDMDAEEFAKEMLPLAQMGATILGGCCGTTPLHIRKMIQNLENVKADIPEKKQIRRLPMKETFRNRSGWSVLYRRRAYQSDGKEKSAGRTAPEENGSCYRYGRRAGGKRRKNS